MVRIGKSELNYGAHLTVDEQLAMIDAVTADDVASLAAQLLRRPVSGAVVGPYAHVDELPAELHEVIS
jgi:predicted Zn-dependent peptidase